MPPKLPEAIPIGDMPGDQVRIEDPHISKSIAIFPAMKTFLKHILEKSPHGKAVISLFGGSGVGKSEIASVLSYYLRHLDITSYILSGDNYPHRIPAQNDAERQRIFSYSGVHGLLASGQYSPSVADRLRDLQTAGLDADPAQTAPHPWLATYQQAGRRALKAYLGSKNESNFSELTEIIAQFKNGARTIWMKRLGRQPQDFWYELIDVEQTKVLLIEWTHGNNESIGGVDLPIYLHSTPEETLAHRKKRKRDSKPDSPFMNMVLQLEQSILDKQSKRAKITAYRSGEVTICGPNP